MSTPKGHATPHAVLWNTLLAFQASPGRHAVVLREPRLLFEHTLPMLMLAANRQMDVPGGQSPPDAVRQAARFFVRHVMLRPNADHYTLMGVQAETDAATLREHYRLLIRLTHPDFDREPLPWPEDAAARVNRAHDVLASPVRRAEYDTQRNQTRGQAASAARESTRHTSARPEKRQPRRAAMFAWAALTVAAAGALVLVGRSQDDRSLGLAEAERRSLRTLTEAPEPPSEQERGDRKVPAGIWTKLVEAPDPVVPPARTAPMTTTSAPQDKLPGLTAESVRASPEDKLARALLASPVLSTPTQTPSPSAAQEAPMDLPWNTAQPPAVANLAAPARLALEVAPEQAFVTAEAQIQQVGASRTPGTNHAMQRLQPVLADLMHMLETGQSERLRQWVASSTSDETSAARFASAYRYALDGAMVVGLGQARFDLHQTADRQVVHGTVQIRLQNGGQQAQLKNFQLRAHFVPRASGPQLARLEAE